VESRLLLNNYPSDEQHFAPKVDDAPLLGQSLPLRGQRAHIGRDETAPIGHDETAMTTEVQFSMAETERQGTLVLRVEGEVDVSTAPELRQRLLSLADRGHTLAVVDLSAVSFVDSTALGVLVSGVKRLRAAGGDLRLVITEPRVSKVFEITGLTEVFHIYPTADEAVRA
jgi:anti-sigma B factor antagonist